MIHDKFKKATGVTWEEAAIRSNQLFFEADQLDDHAYSLLKKETLSPEVWNEFSTAKRKAENKYVEARVEWQRIKSILSSIDKTAEQSARQSLH
jgi:hypothetical protein